MIREAVAAGQFYPLSSEKLRLMIESLVDRKAVKEDVIGLVSPHAGYIYSGAVACSVISRINFKNTFIIIGPNHTGLGKPFSLMAEGSWETPLGQVEIDEELSGKILSISKYIESDELAHQREHSIEVQLPFLQYFKPDVKIVPIILGGGDAAIFKEIGHEIAEAVRESGRDAVILASSDMNHYESLEETRKKDGIAIEAMLKLNADKLVETVKQNRITMCGFGPAAVMINAAMELGAGKAELVRYQTSGEVSGDFDQVVGYAGILVKKMHPAVRLAKKAVELYIKEGKVYCPDESELTSELREKAGVFVSIKKNGELRGCIGTFEPFYDNVAEEIVYNAISASTRDPRFDAVEPHELDKLEYSVDILTAPEPVKSERYLDAKKYGVIVESGLRRGLLLPDIEGVDTPAQQIAICRHKGGIGENDPITLYRFEVKRYR
jgi:MEMO1 family protein